ncbi:hypothetical protein JOF56_003655 [Kibdelosporangium banguiense]|uniref:Uncharacterized protein n=1 Tax=Kibdelosporangium banguiense TaxID=1365924 RepID=A0ABS4TGV9_9PSEU|nr:hypothetical protein [Kibdelosporangium banguiense]MBP2323270.1 hypothetical protein [Kibdelosporangium banguiense]
MSEENIALPLQFGREFELWSYGVSHCLLLLRSKRNIDDPNSTRLDVLFRGVKEMKVPRSLNNISIDLIHKGDPLLDKLGVEREPEFYVFSLTADDYQSGYVVAWSVSFAEDDLDFEYPCAIEDSTFWPHVIKYGQYQ